LPLEELPRPATDQGVPIYPDQLARRFQVIERRISETATIPFMTPIPGTGWNDLSEASAMPPGPAAKTLRASIRAESAREVYVRLTVPTGDFANFISSGMLIELGVLTSGFGLVVEQVGAAERPPDKPPEVLLKDVRGPTQFPRFYYVITVRYSSERIAEILRPGQLEVILGKPFTFDELELVVRIDNIWEDSTHGVLSMPAYGMMFELRYLRVGGHTCRCPCEITMFYAGTKHGFEWTLPEVPSRVAEWSQRYLVVKSDSMPNDVHCQLAPFYRVDPVLAIVISMVLGFLGSVISSLPFPSEQLWVIRVFSLVFVFGLVGMFILIPYKGYRLPRRFRGYEREQFERAVSLHEVKILNDLLKVPSSHTAGT
jgi:hypothetical protein